MILFRCIFKLLILVGTSDTFWQVPKLDFSQSKKLNRQCSKRCTGTVKNEAKRKRSILLQTNDTFLTLQETCLRKIQKRCADFQKFQLAKNGKL